MATKRKTAATAAPESAPAQTPIQAPAQASAQASAATLAADPVETWADVILRTNFAVVEQDSIILLQAASALLEADSPEKVSTALDQNLKLWVAIKAVLLNEDCPIEADTKANLRNLAQYVVKTSMLATQGTIETRWLMSLARLNTNIAEGLLSGQRSKMIQDRAYEIWEEEGRPEGRDREHWTRAEAEISGILSP